MSAVENRTPDPGRSVRRAADRVRAAAGDPLAYLVGLVALVVYVMHGFDGRLSRDLAIYSYAGQQVADGVPPYVGILNRSGPLAHLVPGIGVGLARLGGFDEILGMRLVFLAFAVACVCLVYLLARKLFGSRPAGLAAAATFLAFAGFIEYASDGPREKTLMVLVLLGTLLAIADQRWFVAGIGLSVATLVLQPVFFVGLTAMLVALTAVARGQRLRALVRFVVGGLIPLATCVVYFAIVGALDDFVEAFLTINLKYTEPSPFWARPRKKWMGLESVFGLSSWLILAGLGALAIVTLLALRRAQWREPTRIPAVAVALAGLVGVAWTLRNFNGWPDAFLVLPFAAVGIGGLAVEVGNRLGQRATAALTGCWVAAAVALAVIYATTENHHGLGLQRREVKAALGALPSDASILSIEAPQPLVLAGMTNPTRHQMFVDGLDRYVDDTWPGGLSGFADWVVGQHATLISIGRHGVPSWLRGPLRREYERAGRAHGWIWYVDRSVGPEVVSALRDRARHPRAR